MATTAGVVDVVFCLDTSSSMGPGLQAVKQHVQSFIDGIGTAGQRRVDWRADFLAHQADEDGKVHSYSSLRNSGMNTLDSLYPTPKSSAFFTSNIREFQNAVARLEPRGDEATLIALDTALDFPWRPQSTCHRVVICLTDEPLETGACVDWQVAMIPKLIQKIQDLGVMLFLVAPESKAFAQLARVDRSEYEVVDSVGTGLEEVPFDKVLAFMGKSVSVARLSASQDPSGVRGLFDQASWVACQSEIRGR